MKSVVAAIYIIEMHGSDYLFSERHFNTNSQKLLSLISDNSFLLLILKCLKINRKL